MTSSEFPSGSGGLVSSSRDRPCEDSDGEFLAERRGWLEVRSVPGKNGGCDIAIVIDGTRLAGVLQHEEVSQ